MRTGTARLPLHGGRAPRWLFEKMTRLAREITVAVVSDYGAEELLRRLSDPWWFQAFGCALGFDWHSSGVTTTVCGAVKEGIKGMEPALGFFAAGGKGGRSRKTPSEIEAAGRFLKRDPASLVYASRLSAKVDSSAVQDGYQLYHHSFFFTPEGSWTVVQQGMNDDNGYARRYHWLGPGVREFVEEPHSAVCCDTRGEVLNLVSVESSGSRGTAAELSRLAPEKVLSELEALKRTPALELPARHRVLIDDINPDRLKKTFISTYENQPAGFEDLLALKGVGPKTIRALALVAELVHGKKASWTDPARFSFAHGGKDGHPFPVDTSTYEKTIEFLASSVEGSRLGYKDKSMALKRLASLDSNTRGRVKRP